MSRLRCSLTVLAAQTSCSKQPIVMTSRGGTTTVWIVRRVRFVQVFSPEVGRVVVHFMRRHQNSRFDVSKSSSTTSGSNSNSCGCITFEVS